MGCFLGSHDVKQSLLLRLSGIMVSFGGQPLLSNTDLLVHREDRVALVGRNGSGKSTLAKVAAGLLEQDAGERVVAAGARVGYLEQSPRMTGFETIGDFAASGMPSTNRFKIEAAAQELGFNPATAVDSASGGEKRKAALAKLLAVNYDLMILDEPTNHLDIHAIAWLEDRLKGASCSLVLISHDRALMSSVTQKTVWIDQGTVRNNKRGFSFFEDWRDKVRNEQSVARHNLDKRITSETRWSVEGISARRRRNQGRLRELNALREQRRTMAKVQGVPALKLPLPGRSSKMVIEANDISHQFDGGPILRRFSLRICKGDRIALIGPNGAGKTTLLKILTGALTLNSGSVRTADSLRVAFLEQDLGYADLSTSAEEFLVGRGVHSRDRVDQIMVQGRPRHVISYMKDFLFQGAQARTPMKSLSGGEVARLALARVMASESDLLVLDEPTNDLDVETLDLLQELFAEYPGTVLFVSHDRDFIDRVATTTVAFEGDGECVAYAGGWSDYVSQRQERTNISVRVAKQKASKPKMHPTKGSPPSTGLTFTERHRLQELPATIESLEAEISKLREILSDPMLYSRNQQRFNSVSSALAARTLELKAAEDEWLELETKAEQSSD